MQDYSSESKKFKVTKIVKANALINNDHLKNYYAANNFIIFSL